jgi:hypothetical protein
MKVHQDTLLRRIKKKHGLTFAEYRDKKMACVRRTLVQKAIDLALSGDRALLIFCLKNYCGWSDKQDIVVNNTSLEEYLSSLRKKRKA